MLGQARTIHQFSSVSLIGRALPIWVYFPTLWMQLFRQYFVKWQLPKVLVSSFCIHDQKCTPLHILASFPADPSIDSSVSVTIAALTSRLVVFSCVVLFATICLYYHVIIRRKRTLKKEDQVSKQIATVSQNIQNMSTLNFVFCLRFKWLTLSL